MTSVSDYADNYKYGIYVGNHCQLNDEYIQYAVPTHCAHVHDVDIPLGKPQKGTKRTQLTKFCTNKKKPSPFVTIYKLPRKNFDNLLKVIQEPHFLNPMTGTTEEKYFVKVIKVHTRKDINTALKEFYMTHFIHSTQVGQYHGSDITCKPFYAGLYWSGKTWKFMSVYEEARGIPLSDITSSLWHKATQDKKRIMETITNLVKTLWVLGFAHNDLYPSNVIYDLQTHTAKLIDFEMATRLPPLQVTDLQMAIRDDDANLPCIFGKHYKETAVSLLYLSKSLCIVPMDDDGFIYNTDDHFLPMLSNSLK
jgi:serine/threonine protein kinase